MNHQNIQNRTDWFQAARFGLFTHWGLYAVPGGEWRGQTMDYIGEWIQAKFRIPNAEYERLAIEFNPIGFDAEEWITLAKKAGMRYIVFTAKHHEGFAMYGSKVDKFNIVDATPFKRDPLAELASACQKHGVKLGLYYSQDLDWHHPDAGDPGPEFVKNYGMSWANDWDYPSLAAKDFRRYFHGKALPQITELLSNYGPISLMWFDCPMSISKEDSALLMKTVHDLQPECLVNSRVGNGYGDFFSMGDNQVPVGRISGVGETAATLNDTWGFKYSDQNWKSANDTLEILIGLAGSGVNYLLNIGPMPTGRFPQASIDVLETLSSWMARHSPVIHGTSGNPFSTPFAWGWVTCRYKTEDGPARLYFIFRKWPESEFTVRGLKSKVVSLRIHGSSTELPFSQVSHDGVEVLHIYPAPDLMNGPFPVVEAILEEDLDVDSRLLPQHANRIVLPAVRGQFVSTGEESKIDLSSSPLVGPAGETTVLSDTPTVNEAGIVMNWLSSRHKMTWDLVVNDPGHYIVEVTTTAPHGHSWRGGHLVEIQVGESSVAGVLGADEIIKTPDVRYYPQTISRLGRIHIPTPGSFQAALAPQNILSNENVGLSLVSVALHPEP